jgi:ssDNA-binding replication factor A large subunit
VDYALNSIVDGTKVVIADVRYPNEANAIKVLGGKVYRVERDGVGQANEHASENALEGYEFDGTILNQGSLEGLYYNVETELLQ